MVFKFSIDDVLNRFIPANKLHKLPCLISRFLGHHETTPKSDVYIWIEILVATFCGLSLLEGVFKSNTVFTNHHAPMIIASYGATAILCFNSTSALLAQPRNIFVGHFVSSLIGICIQKLFSLSEGGRNNYWASGALSVGVSSVFMSILNCVHPPAGASALLPSIDEEIRAMSWWYLPTQMISSILIIAVALISGNIIRKYPAYWWTPATLAPPSSPVDEEMQSTVIPLESNKEYGVEDYIKFSSNTTSIEVCYDEIIIPKDVSLNTGDIDVLISLQNRLHKFRKDSISSV